jgi:hypothetical protein
VNPNELSVKERADILLTLAKESISRFDTLAEMSWKLRLSVWAALGAIAAFVVSANTWQPNWIECVIGIVLTVAIVSVLVFSWERFIYKRSVRFIRVSRHWESEVQKLVGANLPDHLRLQNWLGTRGWVSGDQLEPWYTQPVYLSSALITVFFGVLVVVALLRRVR